MIYLGKNPVGFADRHFLSAQGTFTGDGTNSVALSLGFKPDFVYIWADVNYSESGWQGIGHVIVHRGDLIHTIRHASETATSSAGVTYWLTTGNGDFGISNNAPTNGFYGSYSDGTLTLTNKSSSAQASFINSKTYKWVAFRSGGES